MDKRYFLYFLFMSFFFCLFWLRNFIIGKIIGFVVIVKLILVVSKGIYSGDVVRIILIKDVVESFEFFLDSVGVLFVLFLV